MGEVKRLAERNQEIQELMVDGEKLKNFYRFVAQNPHISLYDACQIVIEKPDASVCYSFEEWNALDRRVTKGRKGIPVYDKANNKRFVFDANDTHGDSRYLRQSNSMKKILEGLDELNGTDIAKSGKGDYRIILSGVKTYLSNNQDYLEDREFYEQGVAYMIYSTTGFPKDNGIRLKGYNKNFHDNGELFKGIKAMSNSLQEEIFDAYLQRANTVKLVDDTEEETITDEPVIKEEREKVVVKINSAIKSNYKGYDVLVKRSLDENGTENCEVYLGKRENYDNHGNYDNTDYSLLLVSRNDKMFNLLSSQKWMPSQAEMVENGAFSDKDYEELYKLENGLLRQFEKVSEIRFGLNYSEVGKPFSYPYYQDNKKEELSSFEKQNLNMYEEYMQVQNENPDCYILKRVGDFYEIMGEKAKEVAENIDLTLTGRNVGLPERVPMVGFPFHVMDKYLDKLLNFSSVVVMENGIEPKKILSYAETTKHQRVELEPLSEEESEELDKYFNDKSEEEPEEDYSSEIEEYRQEQEQENEEYEEELEEDDEEDTPDFDYEEKTSEKKEKVKSGKPINDRKRKNKEFSLFDIIDKQEETPEEKAKTFILKLGSSVSNGKYRIADYYLSRPTEKDFVDFLKREYGIGGGSCTEYDHMSDSKGLVYRVGERDDPNRIEQVLNWNQVAIGIADLIDDDNYFYEEEKVEFKDYYAQRHGEDKDRIKAIVDDMVKEGTRRTYNGSYKYDFVHFYNLYDYAKEHQKEIATEITLRDEVDSISLDEQGFEVNYYEKYCKKLQHSFEPIAEENHNTNLNEVGLDKNELGGAKQRFRNNVEAIRLVNTLFRENRDATSEERKVLAKYVGWGGIAQAFDEHNESWQKEYQELKNLLSAEEYTTAKGSVLNAHFTSKEVIEGMYKALSEMGVKGNNKILEPAMGVGNFFGFMPQEISNNAKLYGVELDSVTGRIATKLYPQAKVQIKGFEETSFKNDSFDLMVTNVPFGGYTVFDSDYNKYNFYIHDYFIAKGIDKIKPNGLMAVITSKGTMDKISPTVRKYIADRAELLGAIRLPNTAFKKTANTEVVTDILFFRKREEQINATVNDTEWLSLGKTKEGYEINNYFVNHPEMVLGSLSKETGLYGAEDVTVNPDGRELSIAIEDAIKFLPKDIYVNPEYQEEVDNANVIEADYNVRPLNYKVENGKLYRRVGDEMVKEEIPNSPKDALERIVGMIDLRDSLRYVLNIQSDGCDDETLKREQLSLNYKYDRFVKRYGYLNSQTNTKLFKEDGDSSLLFACEEMSEDKRTATKTDIFSKRTIRPYAQVTQTDDSFEALQISKNERGGVDISYIEELTKKDYDTILNELGNAVFRNPVRVNIEDKYSGFETAEEYLSGKVVEKLETAKRIKQENPTLIDFDKNIKALEEVQPEKIKATDIAVRIGTSWIDKSYYKQFLCQLLHIPYYMQDGLELYYNPHDSSWRVDKTTGYLRNYRTMEMTSVYGTSRANAFRLFEDSLNQRFVQIFDTVEDENGHEKRVLNQTETIAAREKQNKIKEEFKDWIFAEPNRRDELEELYNSMFNQIRLPSYDGSYLKFPNMNPDIELRPHQKNAVARISTGQNTLLHHVVGSGKTFTMVASIETLRRLGLCKKAMIVVPNHLVEQWSSDYLRLYPSAHILTTTKEDVDKQHRERFVSKVAMGDWDAIVISQSAFSKINISPERQIAKIKEQIQAIEESIEQQYMESNSRGSVKNLERIKKSREAMLKKLLDDEKKDNLLCFEKLGVDYLFVDEADAYKNLFMYTKMNNVAGISNAASQRASDLQLKIEYINELHGGDKGVVFATGTPISNSMTEMYTMQTYLSKDTLSRLGVTFFDNWAADFGEAVTSLELAPSGQGYRAKTRFAKFTNLPELLTLYRSFADVQTSDMVKLDVPEAERKVVTIKPSDTVIELTEQIAERADRIYAGGVDPHEDNMLKVTGDGKKLALDPRTLDKLATDEPVSKLSVCAENVFEEWKNSQSIRGTQLVFCDLSTPKTAFEDYEYGKDFDAYNDLKYKLVNLGIPKEQIAFIHEANTDQQKQTLFNNVNAGIVRVLIGSTEKCGAGTNVQKRLVAIHHLDAPYRPRDLIQRDGRGIRQGNMNDKIRIYTYATERTFDSYSYQILENKQRFISQIDRGDLTIREAEDIDETTLSYAEIKAITSANPKIKRKMELDTEIQRLRVLESQYKKNLFALQDKIRKEYPEQIRKQSLYLERVKEDTEVVKTNFNAENFSINVLGKTYTDKKEGGQALMDALFNNKVDTVVAEYAGFKISLNPIVMLTTERSITLSCSGQYTLDIGQSASGNLTRLENFFNEFPARVDRATTRLEQTKHDLEVAEGQVKVPFEHTEKILEINKELAEINAELDLNKRDEIVIDDGEESEVESNTVVDNGDDNFMALPTENTGKRRRKMTEDGYKQITRVKKGQENDIVFGVSKDNIYTALNEDAEFVGEYLGIEPETEIVNGNEIKVLAIEGKNFDEAVNGLIGSGKTVAVFDLINAKVNDDSFIDETDKIAEMQIDLMPDRICTQDNMHKYGYSWNGMLPLTPKRARELSKVVDAEIYKLYFNDTESKVDVDDIENNYLYGIEKPSWKEFIESEKGRAYLATKTYFADSTLKVLNDDMSYVDGAFVDSLTDVVFEESTALVGYMKDKDMPTLEQMEPFIEPVLEEYASSFNEDLLRNYGWDKSNVYTALVDNIKDESLKEVAKYKIPKEIDIDKEQREFLGEEDKEIDAIQNLLDATKLDDVNVYRNRGTLYASDGDGNIWTNKDVYQFLLNEVVQLDENNKIVDGYGVNQDIIDEVVKYSKNYDAKIFPVVSDYRQAVIDSVEKEFTDFKTELLKKDPIDIFYNNYKIHIYTELADTIPVEGPLDTVYYKALFEERGHILSSMYDEFVDDEYASVNTGEDTIDFIKQYCERFHEDIFDKEEEEDKFHYVGKDYKHDIGFYYFKEGLDSETLKEIKDETFMKCIAAPTCSLDKEFLELEYITFLKIGRDVNEETLKINDYIALNEMQSAYNRAYPIEDKAINTYCKDSIENYIRQSFDGLRLNTDYLENLVGLYGVKRLEYVLANTVKQNLHDGRYSVDNKKWANEFNFPNDIKEQFIEINSHPAIVDGLVSIVRQKAKDMPLVPYCKVAEMNENGDYIFSAYRYSETEQTMVPIMLDEFTSENELDQALKVEMDKHDFNYKEVPSEELMKYSKEKMEENKMAENEKPKTKWVEMNVSHNALINKYDKHSFFRMPETSKYKGYTYNIFNDRIKDTRQLVDLESEGHELCYQFILPDDFEITLRNTRTDDEIVVNASEFRELVNGSSDKDYERPESNYVRVSVPPEAARGTFESASLFVMPNSSKYKGYSYYIPNSMVEEDKESEEGRLVMSIPEDFTITIKNRETGDEQKLKASEFKEMCHRTSGIDYDNNRGYEKKENPLDNGWHYVKVPKEARIAEYENRSLFKMPEGEYSGYCFYVPKGCVNDNKDGETLRLALADSMTITLINKQNEDSETVQLDNVEVIDLIQGKTKLDYEQRLKPEREMNTKFLKVEEALKEHVPEEMLNRPNWVGVRTKLKEDGRLEKYLIDCNTGKHAESDNPETWTDFESACKYAKDNGCVALAYALDGKDKVCCVDLDHCINDEGDESELLEIMKNKTQGTYMEKSLSGKGVHFFAKTDGLDVRTFSKENDLEFYQKSHFIAMTGDSETSSKLVNLDYTPAVDVIKSKCEKRIECSGQGRGIEGLSKMSDRDVVDKAINSKHGETFKALYEGKDIRNNHSNSDMALMNRLAFWCNGDKEQMLRIFESSGLYRPEKSADYYECTVIKAIRDTANRFQPQEYQPKAPVSNSNSFGKR